MEKIENLYDTVLIDPNEDLVLLDKTLVQHDSNLIKFIYAICCFDYENLPVPLTRIEEFANALITGEIPNIEPQSRSEQFFKAILTGDISTLPDPQSRGEVLLDKIARGNDDLSDIEPIQSRYELLLAYLIKNGGSLPNLTYVFYQFQETVATFQNTKEKPYKSLSIKGQTYQNILPEPTTPVLTNNAEMFSVDEGLDETIEIVDGVAKSAILSGNTLVNIITKNSGTISRTSNNSRNNLHIPYHYKLIPNKKYYVTFKVSNITGDTTGVLSVSLSNGELSNQELEIKDGRFSIITSSRQSEEEYLTGLAIYFVANGTDTSCDISEIMVVEYQDGMENWDIPYFEGMQSVKMPVLTTCGKNLFNMNDMTLIGNSSSVVDGGINTTYTTPFETFINKEKPLKLKKGTYTFSMQNQTMVGGGVSVKVWIDNVAIKDTTSVATFTLDTDSELYLSIVRSGNSGTSRITDIQIEKSSTQTTHEPFKTNILHAPEEVVLRKVNGVEDTLNLNTGEYVQRTKEIVLNGSENWELNKSLGDDSFYQFVVNIVQAKKVTQQLVVCDKLVSAPNESINNRIWIYDGTTIVIHSSCRNLDEMKTWLQQNPLTVQYELATPIVKTVVLSVVDQDNTVTDLHFFKDGHIIQSSGADTSLIPTLDYQAKTSNSYVMDLMKSNTQYTMKATSASETFTIDGTSYDAVTNGTFTSPSSITNKLLTMSNTTNEEVMIIEGDVTDKTIPYFEGIKSAFEGEDRIEVLSTGKNLWTGADNYINSGANIIIHDENQCVFEHYVVNNGIGVKVSDYEYQTITISYDFEILDGKALNVGGHNRHQTIAYYIDGINVGTDYHRGHVTTYEKNRVYHVDHVVHINLPISEGQNNDRERIGIEPNRYSDDTPTYCKMRVTNFQITLGNVIQEYEPHKSNSTKIPLLAPLRSINEEIRDEIDIDLLNKKAVITQRIELDDATNEYIQLENPIVEEVDIVVTDQDGNEIPKLKSYDEVTHFSINSLIPPIVEVEVQTSNQEDLETLSDTIDEIENQQDQLMTTSEEQEDGVQSVMLGLTEVFEESEEL